MFRARENAEALPRDDVCDRAPGRPRRESTVYQCPKCDQRYLGTQRCEECGTWCRRGNRGGLCPACDEPVAFPDLLEDANE